MCGGGGGGGGGSHRLKEIEKWGRRRVLRGMDSSVAGV